MGVREVGRTRRDRPITSPDDVSVDRWMAFATAVTGAKVRSSARTGVRARVFVASKII